MLSLKKTTFLQLNTNCSKCETTSNTSSNFRTKVPSSLPKISCWAAVLKKSRSFQVSSSSQRQKYLFDWFGVGQKRSCRFTQLTCGWLSMAPSRDWLSLSVWLWAHSRRSWTLRNPQTQSPATALQLVKCRIFPLPVYNWLLNFLGVFVIFQETLKKGGSRDYF